MPHINGAMSNQEIRTMYLEYPMSDDRMQSLILQELRDIKASLSGINSRFSSLQERVALVERDATSNSDQHGADADRFRRLEEQINKLEQAKAKLIGMAAGAGGAGSGIVLVIQRLLENPPI